MICYFVEIINRTSPAKIFISLVSDGRCKLYNKMNTKLEQGRNRSTVVKFTPTKLNKSIAFFRKLCYYKDSRDD